MVVGKPGARKGDFARIWGLGGAAGVMKPGVRAPL